MNIRTRNALSLTELLVATMLMGIVMAGIGGFSLFVKQAQDSTARKTILAITAATAMHYLSTDALKAVGDSSDRGIRTHQSGTTQSICFRHDVSDPASYAEDIWVCYYHGASFDLQRYYDVNPAQVPCVDETVCRDNSAEVLDLVVLEESGDGEFFEVVDDSDGRFQYIDFTLNAISNNDTPADPIKNPTHLLKTRISPPAHGR